MNKTLVAAALSIVLFGSAAAPGAAQTTTSDTEARAYFEYVADIAEPTSPVPRVVEVEIEKNAVIPHTELTVYEEGTGEFVAHMYVRPPDTNVSPTVRIARNAGRNLSSIQDDDRNTFYTIEAFPDGVQRGDTWISTIDLQWPAPVRAERALVFLDESSAIPSQVQVLSGSGVVAPWQPYETAIIDFDREVESSRFVVQFEHTNDLQIAEITVPHKTDPYERLYFLAQPDERYTLYGGIADADTVSLPRRRDFSTTNTFDAGVAQFTRNPLYAESDHDGDGVRAAEDNCTAYANPEQLDADQNGIGDACEDFDQDGQVSAVDNCPDRPNSNQKDTDGDGIGDACDDTESRLTEQYSWVPLAGIGIAGIVLVTLFILVARNARERSPEETEEEEQMEI